MSLALIRQRYVQDGGAERFVARALEALKGQDVRVTLISREWNQADGGEVVIVNPFYIGRLWRDWSFSRAVRKLLQRRDFDIVQSHERIPDCTLYRAGDGVHREWLRQLARARGPLGRLGILLNPYHRYLMWVEKRMFAGPRLKAVICNSKMVRDEIKRHFGLPEEKLHVIYSGVDTETFHPRLKQHRRALRARYGVSEQATLFLFVGSGFERKGMALLLEAMAALSSDTCLIVVGRDKRIGRFEARAGSLGLEGRVRFAGNQPDVGPFYGAADALVLPTLYDPFPNVVLEAMASGLPVVTSDKSGAAEIVRPNESGFVCDALDVNGLRAALESLRVPSRREAMSVMARATVERLDLARMGERLLELYRRLAPR